MKTEPRFDPQDKLPELDIRKAPVVKALIDGALDRLELSGYQIDQVKLQRFIQCGLVGRPTSGESGERTLIARLRRILDVEHRLAPSGDVDALCFHLAASGVEEVPPEAVGRHLSTSLGMLFTVGDRLIGEVTPVRGVVGPDGEQRVGRSMARLALQSFRPAVQAERIATEAFLTAAFVAYVRSTWANPRPNHELHLSSRLVNLDAELSERQPLRANEPALPPISDRAAIVSWLNVRSEKNGDGVLAAVRNSAALVRLHVAQYPELELPWRDAAARYGQTSMTVLQMLALVPPILAVAFLQGGQTAADARLERTLTRLMHFWGTLSVDSVRFDLANGAFPWVRRA
jgi:hypothetical protein